ncbi:hypothetical protein Zm00014a_044442 [Zea mays]|uniref:Uncharacterized protein n=1 Tax=Zea mays TaxID=4577 RepID=A0A3L6FY27_MAIZE|nr:hypothetical protein Zm00014a_044442 [Zea mays]
MRLASAELTNKGKNSYC